MHKSMQRPFVILYLSPAGFISKVNGKSVIQPDECLALGTHFHFSHVCRSQIRDLLSFVACPHQASLQNSSFMYFRHGKVLKYDSSDNMFSN